VPRLQWRVDWEREKIYVRRAWDPGKDYVLRARHRRLRFRFTDSRHISRNGKQHTVSKTEDWVFPASGWMASNACSNCWWRTTCGPAAVKAGVRATGRPEVRFGFHHLGIRSPSFLVDSGNYPKTVQTCCGKRRSNGTLKFYPIASMQRSWQHGQCWRLSCKDQFGAIN